ncbi:peptidoglycan D,D-transpeptidase FtsI family protein [Phaeovulum vinaykumarii]|uniref:Cell division protein FtsI (Penicillin-binding protein 3) n=1 Tax=Phaeovulum vinaykumarii TaxID=407234 RepID=A0A1N7JTG4_9RHOB|nr:penicillin-binding protein 2 [Phaeovulum vinaykumarii]SIS52652.1 cell division protein FtsI (penicillin-binding protein 3) [Phaeovulum vinaykumarii]SOB91311.1 cell division protein FtsI (penicillin-binding protein 3) [Phaeovulum vinaykumarii]
MIRTPLRPLARILSARERGENPDAIERENIRLRAERSAERLRRSAERRLYVMAGFFGLGFLAVGVQMGALAASEPVEPRLASSGPAIVAQRADITDRRGRVLATNLLTHSLYAQTRDMVDPARAAQELAKIFPDLDPDRLTRQLTDGRSFMWIKRRISPEQMQAVHDIGEPGLLFGPREMRLYPNGPLAAHVLGGARFGTEGVHSAEVIGVAGVERAFDGWLRDPANGGAPLVLSLDLSVQSAVEDLLDSGMKMMNAKGATAVLMEVRTGEIVAMASLPDFDPNDRPAPLLKGDASDSPLFNRAVQGVYELGSTFKVFAIAQALDLGLVAADTMIPTKGPLVWGRFKINDFHSYGAQNSVTDILVKSSNVGTARIATMIGPERQRDFLTRLGFTEPTQVELTEAPTGRPLLPAKWSDISSLTISYGHGLSASPLHLAAAYATLANGGRRVTPTLVHGAQPKGAGEQVVSPEAAAQTLAMMRAVVTRGTASFGEVRGYRVAGKTGTADKPRPTGGYYDDKVIATFASVFPVDDPQYVLVLTLDEPVETSGPEPRRTAGWTAVPVAAEVIRRTAPLLGLRPEVGVEPEVLDGVTLVRN